MKSDIRKKMRAIRVQLKLHSITEKEKEKLRKDLNALKKLSKVKNKDDKISSTE